MIAIEELARRARYLNRLAYQRAADKALAGDKDEREALELRYMPIIQYQKEGPDVGERDFPESEAGRIN